MAKLTVKSIENARAQPKRYLINDGQGLNLQIHPNGSKYWLLRYRFGNKAKVISLGVYPQVSLQEARILLMECRKDVFNGLDPAITRKQRKISIAIDSSDESKLLKTVAQSWYQSKVNAGRSASALKSMRIYLNKDILPLLGDLPIHTITRADCLKVQERIEARGATNTAQRVRNYLKEIFSQAVAKGLCEINPTLEMKYVALPKPKVQHYPHLLESELPAFLQALSQSRSRFIATTAAKMTVLTASRPGMVRFATWDEIDFGKKLWVLPAQKMKMRRDHTVPLCSQLIQLLKQLHQFTGRQAYLFPGSGSKNPTISENTVNKVFRLIGYKGKMVGHGSRHTASTLLREHLWPKDIVEAQLAHREKGVAGDYNHAAYVKHRAIMMQWYADYLDALKDGLTPEQSIEFEQQRNKTLSGLYQEMLKQQLHGQHF